MRNLVRKSVNGLGFDLVRYKPKLNPFEFIAHHYIKTIIDAGANIGQFAHAARAVVPSAKIYSFEPMVSAFTALQKSFEGDTCFTAFNMALGEENKHITLYHNGYSPSSSLLKNTDLNDALFPHTKNVTEEKVMLCRLDDVLDVNTLEKNILLKLDVQGYEEKVLQGASKLLGQVSHILIETAFVELYEDQPLFDDIYGLLRKEGFFYKGSVQQKMNPKTGDVLFEDSVFSRTE